MFTATLRRFCKNENGNVFLLVALGLPVLIGAMGLGAEVAYWRVLHRGMQDAADSAALAAAANNGATYASEAKSVTSRYGFADGVNQVTVSPSNPATAPGCTQSCYQVTISQKVPLSLSQVIGYNGDTTVNGQKAVTVAATAVATTSGPGTGNTQYCILALANSGAAQALTTNGAPFANLYGCNVMSNTNATCNGHDLNATYGDAHKTSSGCGNTPRSGEPLVPDPLASLASNIPSGSGCNNTYPQEPAKKKDPALPASNQWSGTLGFSGTQVVCGDQQLIGNTQINNTTLVIENGQLDTNGYTLTGDNVTVIFSGTSGGSYEHVPTGGGTIDITPPTSGTWEGIAIYQDPSLTTGVNVSAAGNSPAWNISGAIYLPNSGVTFSGAVNKSRYGYQCFFMIVDNITVNGTADIFANDNQCGTAYPNLKIPTGGSRGKLVY